MKIVLTVDLQEDAGQSVLKASQTKNSFVQFSCRPRHESPR